MRVCTEIFQRSKKMQQVVYKKISAIKHEGDPFTSENRS